MDVSALALLINGKPVPGSARSDIVNPATGAVAVSAPLASPAQADQAVSAARAAASAWAVDFGLRAKVLTELAAQVATHQDGLARILSLETGLPFKVARDEIAMAGYFLKYRAGSEPPIDRIHDDGKQTVQVHRRPVGTVGAIIPWNAPMMIACEKIGTAFAAGDTVIVKPSPLAPLTLLAFGQLAQEIVPPGVLAVLPGSDDLGAALVSHPEIPMISFTGSIEAGRAIMANAAPRLKRLSLELGGNDAAIVMPDIDVAKTAPKLFFGAFYRSGQICAAIKRLYVHRDVLDDLAAALATIAEGTVLGDPFDESVTMGPLSNRPQFEKVATLVDASLSAGGKALTGGGRADTPGFFFAPTLVTEVGADNPLVTEEQFGPALPVQGFSDIDEAIASANETEYGLGGSVWTSDVERGVELAGRLECGSAWVNRHGLVVPDTPFGGMKQSGLGRANGLPGLDSYSELQTVSAARPRQKP